MALRNYKPNEAFFKKMAVGPEIKGIVKSIAEDAKTIAKSLSQGFRITGEYADSFEASTEIIEWTGQYPGPRISGKLTATAPYSAAVEWGYKGRSQAETSSAHRVLGRTLDLLSRSPFGGSE